uniref:Uncharacterized protein n=1 Tax=Mucochytrium quahogii TaxID=96639 RepID=A0A7S2SN11_9STRA|mmetsp:Transcript_15316/g.24937  ORF Transcript_15316/g.24937 Transcript_15316/m.24937 type:complete len:345 (+) Transcript_15316:137-1171(+)|eukprot:CAMPEP_0203744958 /NCGR_PEP_ID=MMETSP0098-20131031/853_1 /ASSEMBLY_ACC=CAM_ASM_000208 /TAXON_ID=96639 /ORGANISM=" , Strain NY0313808BC1" /LENGTH=344 /DNA_ID=CAMNT_0050632607 /DNA_START=170 /DNA_END=1204 /DNA_ORIENTATION=-
MDDVQSRIRAIALDKSLSDAERRARIHQIYATLTRRAADKAKNVPEGGDGLVPCKHYDRKCSIVAQCCGGTFSCRLCHDAKTDHEIERCATTEMVCRECKLRQPINAQCSNPECSWKNTRYYCEICRMWSDDENKRVFHCEKCGLCRIGKREDFIHCDKCNLCLPPSLFRDHECVDSNNNCAICGEFLQTSVVPVTLLRCGHALHSTCFTTAQRKHLFYCPLCRKSFVDPSEVPYQQYEQEIAACEMPEEFRGVIAEVSCNDCNKVSETPFHFMGHKCQHCNSFNTIVQKRYRPGQADGASSASAVNNQTARPYGVGPPVQDQQGNIQNRQGRTDDDESVGSLD